MSKARYVVGYQNAEQLFYWGGKDTTGRSTRFVPLNKKALQALEEELKAEAKNLVVYKLVPVRNVWHSEA